MVKPCMERPSYNVYKTKDLHSFTTNLVEFDGAMKIAAFCFLLEHEFSTLIGIKLVKILQNRTLDNLKAF